MLLNLASVAGTADPAVLWGFIRSYAPEASAERYPRLDELVRLAVAYYRDFVAPAKAYRTPAAGERAAFEELLAYLEGVPAETSGDDLQNEVYEIGKRHGFEPLRAWFKALYEVLLGQGEGPRMGSFFRLYGTANSAALVRRALAGELAPA
jgi:lysyl-tRNA synthetase class 1